MKRRLELLQQESLQAALYDEERHMMREALLDYIHQNPAPSASYRSTGRSTFLKRNRNRLLVMAIILLAVASVVFTAQRSAPGDTLYVVKRGVNERAQGMFAFSAEAKARHQVGMMEHRLVEVIELDASGTLTPERHEALRADFKDHIGVFNTHLKSLIDTGKEQNIAKAALVNAYFNTTLNKNARGVRFFLDINTQTIVQ